MEILFFWTIRFLRNYVQITRKSWVSREFPFPRSNFGKNRFLLFSPVTKPKITNFFFFQYLEYIMDISRYFHVNSTIRSVCFFTKRRNFSKITEFLHCPTCKIRDCAFNKLMRCKRIRAFSSSSDGERRIKNETMRHKWYAIRKNI